MACLFRAHPSASRHVRPSTATAPSSMAAAAAAATMMFRFVVLLALCSVAFVALLRGSYGPEELVAGPGFSRLLRVSSLFVQDITVRTDEEEEGEGPGGEKNGLVLYGLAGAPRLLGAPAASWTTMRARRIFVVPANSHRERVYFLNEGSQIQVDYSVDTGAELIYPLHIIIAQGKERFTEWTANLSVHNATLSWRIVHGIGTVKQSIVSSSDYYYVAVGNLNDQNTTVTLDFRIRAAFYDTTGADYACSPAPDSPCTYRLPILGHNAVVLSSGSTVKQRPDSDDEQQVKVKLSYGPRWIVFVTGSTILAVILLLLYEVMSALLGCCNAGGTTSGGGGDDQRRTSLLAAGSKEGEEASLGSSYDSVSDDGGEDVEGGGNYDEEGRRLCVVCCDARKDCFFLPCGHSATCHACGTRVLEEGDGSCPFCRRKLKKVRRIFAV
ncbi:uncharacterized protein LOC104583123 [Brachypodium distachyon]|uniref:RING-type domain-containing protein n=2 Tax=Brachypodium distachyon TaxID=15368 RepID=A0A2K2D9F1_BRADI|nr:uncharacterized protein LOC104583123 [Brachypodium distachyon]PNT70893.1 hypothetical protein BRADI_2g19453v3 [Brachypodium distachyon]|eukprot:XP_024315717.1 uncharacterized protein LOC104583123 [Brachypodium distachyon]